MCIVYSFINFLTVYDSELGRDLINHVIELLKKIVSVISGGPRFFI
jgi:hypothetical protein